MFYTYKALHKGKVIKGKIEAAAEKDVVSHLKQNGYSPISVKKVESLMPQLNAVFDRITFTDIVDITRQLAIMLNAGLTLIDSFMLLKKQTQKPTLLKVLDTIDNTIRGGDSLSSALQNYPNLFSNLYISLVKSGEASGKLNTVLLKLAENMEKEREFRAKLKGALIYPVVVVIGMLVVAFIMITFVVPRLLGLYKDFDIELPLTTKILIGVSSFFEQFWIFILGAVFVSIIFARSYLSTKKGKLMKDRLLLSLPYIKNVIVMSVLVDATRTLSILISSGISILDALQIIIETTSSITYQMAFKNMYKQVEKGFSLGTAMNAEGVFPPILIQMTSVGEQTGKLDDTFSRISSYFEMESDIAIKTMTTLIEPAILVLLGLGVGFIVLSVITPIYNLTSSIR